MRGDISGGLIWRQQPTAEVRVATVSASARGSTLPIVRLVTAAALVGSRTSRRKAASSSRHGRLGGRPRRQPLPPPWLSWRGGARRSPRGRVAIIRRFVGRRSGGYVNAHADSPKEDSTGAAQRRLGSDPGVYGVRGHGPALHGVGAPPPAAATAPTRAFLDDYCTSCHNDRLKTGGLSLDAIDPSHIATDAADLVKRLRVDRPAARRPGAPTIPPTRRPSPTSRRSSRRRAAHPRPSRALHRLNRAEYANAIRDFLGIEVDVTAMLPPDDAAFGFDNEPTRSAAHRRCSRPTWPRRGRSRPSPSAIPRLGRGLEKPTPRGRISLVVSHDLDGLPLGTIGGMTAPHTFPADGE